MPTTQPNATISKKLVYMRDWPAQRGSLRELIIADGTAPEILALLQGALVPAVALGHHDSPAEVLQTITTLLAGEELDTLHIVAHGRPGVLNIGGQSIDTAMVRSSGHLLATWNCPEVALWACFTGADGTFVEALHKATGAKVYATTNVLAGGNVGPWQLSGDHARSKGISGVLSSATVNAWPHTLAVIDIAKVFKSSASNKVIESNSITLEAVNSLANATNVQFTSANPADASFSGNNVAGTLTYTIAAQNYTVYGVVSRNFKQGADHQGFYFTDTGPDYVLGNSETAFAYLLQDLTEAGNPFVPGSSYGCSSDPVADDLNAILNEQSTDISVTTVDNVVINEDSPYAVFKISNSSGAAKDISALDVPLNGSPAVGEAGTADFNGAVTYQYYGVDAYGTDLVAPLTPKWRDYGGTISLASASDLYVRVGLVVDDTTLEYNEAFSLNVTVGTGPGAPVVQGLGTINDIGQGKLFPANFVPLTQPANGTDDDRDAGVVSVGNIDVNEGSPYAVFEVTGTPLQVVSLALASGTATGDGQDFGLFAPGSDLQVWDGVAWVPYAGGPVALDANGELLVRTAITNDTISDNNETFQLRVTNTADVPYVGTATIKDDGTGTLFLDAAPTGGVPATSPGPLNNDAPTVLVSGPEVSEGSNAVFQVRLSNASATPSTISLGLSGGTASASDYSTALSAYYYDAGVKT
ncbi:MAG: hypothetical protein RL014_619, partial [Pseudomonadota bacterium]